MTIVKKNLQVDNKSGVSGLISLVACWLYVIVKLFIIFLVIK